MLKYVNRLMGVLMPDKAPAIAVGTNGPKGYQVLVTDKRLLMLEEIPAAAKLENELPMKYVARPKSPASEIFFDAKSGAMSYPKNVELLDPPDEKEFPAISGLINIMHSLTAKMSVFTMPWNLGNLKHKYLLVEIRNKSMYLRCGDSMNVTKYSDPVNYGNVEVIGEYVFVMPLELFRVMKTHHEGPFPFGVYYDEKKNTIYLLTYTRDFRALYSCVPINSNDLKTLKEKEMNDEPKEPTAEELAQQAPPSDSVPPENQEEVMDDQTAEEAAEEETADVTDDAEEAAAVETEMAEAEEQVDEAAEGEEKSAPSEDGSDEEPGGGVEACGSDAAEDGDPGDDGADGDAGSADGDGDSVVDGSDNPAPAAQTEDVDPLEALDVLIPAHLKAAREAAHAELVEAAKLLKNAAKQIRPALKRKSAEPDAAAWKAKYEESEAARKELQTKYDDVMRKLAPIKDIVL